MGAAYDQATLDNICARLRGLVQGAFQKHLYATAIFYADKLVSLSRCEPEDLYTLAECFFKNREYRRVLHLLRKHSDAVRVDDRLKLLAAQSLLECRDWDECLRYLEDHTRCDGTAEDSKMASVFALLRGRVYEVTENQENALTWYERAVQLDPYCHEALERLVGSHLLTLDREVALLRGLRFHEEDEWLRHLYAARLSAARATSGPVHDAAVPAVASSSTVACENLDGAAFLECPPDFAIASPVAVAMGSSLPSAGSPDALGDVSTAPACVGAAWGQARQRRLRQAVNGDSPWADEYPAPLLPPALVTNGHTLAAQSTRYFYEGDYESCYQVSKRVLEDDPYHLATLPVHVASLVMLDMKSVVFYVAHQLVNAYPTTAVAWFTVGCYYYMVRKYEQARRYFHKALGLDHSFAPAWIAFGHAFAQHDESDQAFAAYRTACRLFPGSHLPWLFIGMEHLRTKSLQLAHQCLECARTLMPTDPLIYNELGVAAFQQQDYGRACDLLLQALRLFGGPHEAACANLGHAFLKCHAYDRALDAFRQAHRLEPRRASVLSGIAFSLHLQDKPEEAIEYYHRALAIQRDDAFSAEMLNYAVQEAAERPCRTDGFEPFA